MVRNLDDVFRILPHASSRVESLFADNCRAKLAALDPPYSEALVIEGKERILGDAPAKNKSITTSTMMVVTLSSTIQQSCPAMLTNWCICWEGVPQVRNLSVAPVKHESVRRYLVKHPSTLAL